jgi:hypothetical protein
VKGTKLISVFRLNMYFYYVKYKMNLAYEIQTLQMALAYFSVAFFGNQATFHTNTILRKCPGFDLGKW